MYGAVVSDAIGLNLIPAHLGGRVVAACEEEAGPASAGVRGWGVVRQPQASALWDPDALQGRSVLDLQRFRARLA